MDKVFYMYQKLFGIILFLSVLSCENSTRVVNNKSEITCDSLMQVAAKKYNSADADKTITKFREAADCFLDAGKNKNASYAFLNISTLQDEKLNEIEAAISSAKKSRSLNNDSFHIANVDKLLGLFYGKNKNLDSANYFFDQSAKMFRSVDFEKGVDVVNYDRALVYYYNEKYEQSKDFYHKSLEKMDIMSQHNRIFAMNNFGIILGRELHDTTFVHERILANNHILSRDLDIAKVNRDSFLILKARKGNDPKN